MRRGLPFDIKIPNADTVEAMRQAESGEGLTEYSSVEELMSDW